MPVGPSFYLDRLYPLQDEVLAILSGLETGFYVTGGTAASRGYLHHRFSDDLELFVNDDERFGLWAERFITALVERSGWELEVLLREEPKDLADVWGFCCKLALSLEDALVGAQSKAAGLFAPDVARVLLQAGRADRQVVRWSEEPDPERYLAELHGLGERLLLIERE